MTNLSIAQKTLQYGTIEWENRKLIALEDFV